MKEILLKRNDVLLSQKYLLLSTSPGNNLAKVPLRVREWRKLKRNHRVDIWRWWSTNRPLSARLLTPVSSQCTRWVQILLAVSALLSPPVYKTREWCKSTSLVAIFLLNTISFQNLRGEKTSRKDYIICKLLPLKNSWKFSLKNYSGGNLEAIRGCSVSFLQLFI